MMYHFPHRWQLYVRRLSWNGQVDTVMFAEDPLNGWMANQPPFARKTKLLPSWMQRFACFGKRWPRTLGVKKDVLD